MTDASAGEHSVAPELSELPVWRSLLYVPANVARYIDGAHRAQADAIILDLEDSVPHGERPRARRDLQASAATVARSGAEVVVRINRPWRQAFLDLEAAIAPRVQALALTKVESGDHVRLIAEAVGELEAERRMPIGTTRLIVMIETAAAFFRMPEIASSHHRIVAMTLGGEDFALSVGMVPEAEGLFLPKQQLAIAARAAGIMPLGFIGTVADYRDLDAFRRTVQRSRRLGFLGASVIHPSQVPILNAEFAPGEEEVGAARRIVAAYQEATAAGRGSIAVDDKMVDVPVVKRAQQTLQRHAAIQERERRRGSTAQVESTPR